MAGTQDPSWRLRLAASVAVALFSALLAAPRAPATLWLAPDAVEHLAIANAWAHGSGFVDPVKWSYNLPDSPPLPAAAVRPPFVPALLAIPLGLGATLAGLHVFMAVWSSGVAGLAVWVASRFMRLPAAAAVGLLLGSAPAWLSLAPALLTETTGVAGILLVVLAARGVLGSVPAASLCALATLVAWLARPNLGALALAVAVAALCEPGNRPRWRRKGVWAYVGVFAVLVLGVQLGSSLSTGSTVYSGYAAETLSYRDLDLYGRQYQGTWTFLRENAAEIADEVQLRIQQIKRGLLDPRTQRAGWILPVALLFALLRRGPGSLERRICALSALGLGFTVAANYVAYEPRYLILPWACGLLCIGALLDAAARWLEVRLGSPDLARWVAVTPLILAVVYIATGPALPQLDNTRTLWSAYRSQGAPDALVLHGRVAKLCPLIHPDALVATPDPWPLALVCGNATMRLPRNLAVPELRRRFMREHAPDYVVSSGGLAYAWVAEAKRLREIGGQGSLLLYEAQRRKPRKARWTAPPPPACAGRDPNCTRPAH